MLYSKYSQRLNYIIVPQKLKESKEKTWAQKNPEERKRHRRKYRLSARGVFKELGRGSNGRHDVTITYEEFAEWYDSQEKACPFCGIKQEHLQDDIDPLNARTFRLCVDRVDASLGYESGNLQLCCFRCNNTKSNYFDNSEMRMIGNIVKLARQKRNADKASKTLF